MKIIRYIGRNKEGSALVVGHFALTVLLGFLGLSINFMRRPQSGWRRFRMRTDGMSAVEFALLLPVMLLVVCGIMAFGNLNHRIKK